MAATSRDWRMTSDETETAIALLLAFIILLPLLFTGCNQQLNPLEKNEATAAPDYRRNCIQHQLMTAT